MRRGCSAPSGSVAGGEVGGPEAQHVGDGDRAVAGAEHVADHAADAGVGAAERLDRRRVVVRLGLEGERRRPSTNDTIPALPTNAERTNGASIRVGGVAELAQQRRRSRSPSSVMIAARNVLCAQCSLHVWASVSSSTSVGSRPRAGSGRGWRAARRGRAPAPARRRAAARPSSSRPRIGDRPRRPAASPSRDGRPARCVPVPSARSPGWRSRGAAGRRRCVAVAARRELDAPAGRRRRHRHAELRGGVDDGVGGDVGDAGVEGDLDGVGRRRRARPTWPSAAADRRGSAPRRRRSLVVELAVDEGDVATRDGAGKLEVDGRRCGGDGPPRGSSPIVEMVSRDPAGTAPTLQRRSEDVPSEMSDAASIAWSPWPTKPNARRRPGSC